MENWIQEQVARNSSSFDAAMLAHYPEAAEYTSDPDRYFDRVCEQCNYLEAAKLITWDRLLPANAKILDLAGGTGWLSAYLSSLSTVREITIVDASKTYLETNLPASVRRLRGDAQKISPTVGWFSPLLIADNSLDAVVVSSSLHHAENLEAVLKEIRRVIVPGGRCFILNETPASELFYLRSMVVSFVRTFFKTIGRRYVAASPSISASGILYDPLLGDRIYPGWYWREAILRAGLRLENTIDTGLPTVKGGGGIPLVHFVCVKV